MKYRNLLPLFLLLTCFWLEGESQPSFQTVYGPYFYPREVRQNSDSGFVIVGQMSNDLGLMRTDKAGNITWLKSYPSELQGEGTSVVQTADSGFIAVGGSLGAFSHHIYTQIVKVDKYGEIVWQQAVDSGYQETYIINKTVDGNYFAAGTSLFSKVFCAKFNDAGNLLWVKKCSEYPTVNMYTSAAIQTQDGGFLIGGATNGAIVGDTTRTFLIKLDNSGNFSWAKFSSDPFVCKSLVQNGSGVFMLGYHSGKISLSKLDSVGNFQWGKTYSGYRPIAGGTIIKSSSGKYLISGTHDSVGSFASAHYLLTEIDSAGEPLWSKTYGGPLGETRLESVGLTMDGGFVIAGADYNSIMYTNSGNLYLIKTDSTGTSGCHEANVTLTSSTHTSTSFPFTLSTTNIVFSSISLGTFDHSLIVSDACLFNSVPELEALPEISISPNPFSSYATLSSEKQILDGKIELFDVLGKVVTEMKVTKQHSVIIDRNDLPSGIYFWRLTDKNSFSRSGKLIIE